MWTHLSRIRGGIGSGDRAKPSSNRPPRDPPQDLDTPEAAEDVAEHRAISVRDAAIFSTAALVGYTNAGSRVCSKALSGQDVFIEDRLFATVDTLAREVDVGEGYRYRLTDTVGLFAKLPHHLVASFRRRWKKRKTPISYLHVIDASHPGWEDQLDVVERETTSVSPKRSDSRLQQGRSVSRPAAFLEMYGSVIRMRSYVGHHARRTTHDARCRDLRRALRTSAQALRSHCRDSRPVSDGKLLARLHREPRFWSSTQTNGVVTLRRALKRGLLGRLDRKGVEVVLG